jgi:hypothetical protein
MRGGRRCGSIEPVASVAVQKSAKVVKAASVQ